MHGTPSWNRPAPSRREWFGRGDLPQGIAPVTRTDAEEEIRTLKNIKTIEWTTRGVPPDRRRQALNMAEEWARRASSWHLEVLTGILPDTTLRAIEGPLTKRLMEKALNDMAEKWLTSMT